MRFCADMLTIGVNPKKGSVKVAESDGGHPSLHGWLVMPGSGRPQDEREVASMSHIDQTLLARMHRYWNAANYLTVGQIYLQDNPLFNNALLGQRHGHSPVERS